MQDSELMHYSFGETRALTSIRLRCAPLLCLSLLFSVNLALAADGPDPARASAHWAFHAPVRPATPSLTAEKAQLARHPIDHFILARLEEEGMEPAPRADRIALLRRLSLDLIGLPPTLEEVEAFLADAAPGAYERQVERLLKSPHYGERWGRHWLDAARYADSDGFEKDKSRLVWFYRDYVIKAFNQDLPYDQFIIEQLAGDLLPEPTQDQLVATGFLRNSMVNEEGGIDPEQFRMDAMFDRMDCIGKSVLGLTIQCAQCHTHKYDPISQEEYYRIFAFLNNDHEAQPVVYTEEEQGRVLGLTGQMAGLEEELRGRHPDWPARMEAWETSMRVDQPEWTVLPIENAGDNSQRYLPQADLSLLAQGYAPTKFTAPFRVTNHLAGITAFRLELLPDPNLPAGGPGRSFLGTCALTEFSVDLAPLDNPSQTTRLKIVSASADYDQPERPLEPNFDDRSKDKRVTGPVSMAMDGNPHTAWGINAGPGLRNQARKAVFVCESPAGTAAGSILTFHLQQNHGGWNSDDHMNNNLGRFRISATTHPPPVTADPLPREVRRILERPRANRTPEETARVFSYWRTTVPEWAEVNARIEALWQQWPAGTTTFALHSRTEPRDTRLLLRGDWLKPGDPVAAGVPAFLHDLPPGADGSRLALARWLVDRCSPTTARVFVNRVWQSYFGRGLVNTPEDFGLQSEPPSHPELLDWLACEFMDGGWRIKSLHRMIVTSATYQQDSRVTPEQYERDPYNVLLARGPRFRVEGEIVRDIALTASGLLNRQVGGPSVMPPAPEYLFQPPASYAPFPWVNATGPEKFRRALYTFRRRSTPYPMLQTFDVPNADFSCVRRQRSNSPLQALVALNEPLFMECAQALARSTLAAVPGPDAVRIEHAFRRVLSRAPAPEETVELLELLEKQRHKFSQGWANPNEVAFGQVTPPDDITSQGLAPTQVAAFTMVARVLLNLDETLTKE